MTLSIATLKNETYLEWELLHDEQGAYAQGFKADIRKQFGDLRKRETWERAAVYYTALGVAETPNLEDWQKVCWIAIPGYLGKDLLMEHYQPELLDCLMQMPKFVEIVKLGLEQVYQREDLDKEQAQIESLKDQLLAIA
ncbi:hypothetical protein SPB21_02430 [Leptothoe sp. ISB3NOV94-8A]